MVESEHATEDADANPGRARRDRRGERERGRTQQSAVTKVTLGEHDAIKAERLRLVRLMEDVLVRLATRPHQEQPDAHRTASERCAVAIGSCGAGSRGRTCSTKRRIDARHCSWSSVK